ncbi:MAG: hypothetical protein EAZ77_04215 [Nostocales cyanobacterium]|nr:MAG: hypothetical protein EAZ77_04215 [Nostocales cyanobacterium]
MGEQKSAVTIVKRATTEKQEIETPRLKALATRVEKSKHEDFIYLLPLFFFPSMFPTVLDVPNISVFIFCTVLKLSFLMYQNLQLEKINHSLV